MQHEVATAAVRTAWATQMLHHGESLADGLDTGRSQSTRFDGRAWTFEGGIKLAFGGIGNTNPHHSRVSPNLLDAMNGVSVSCSQAQNRAVADWISFLEQTDAAADW